MSLADQIKTWYELESYGAFKQVDARSTTDKRGLSVSKNDSFHDGERYIVPMLWNDKESTSTNNYFSSLAQLKSLEKRLDKDPSLREKSSLRKLRRVLNGASKCQDPSLRKLPKDPSLRKLRRVLNGASKCHGASLNKFRLVGLDLL